MIMKFYVLKLRDDIKRLGANYKPRQKFDFSDTTNQPLRKRLILLIDLKRRFLAVLRLTI